MLGARGRWEAIRVRLATWNVNSVKARLPRLLEWLDDRGVNFQLNTRVTDLRLVGESGSNEH